jgi:hypothetical protein
MVADWTDYDPGIADFVASHGRSGIPLYVLYDGREATASCCRSCCASPVNGALEALRVARLDRRNRRRSPRQATGKSVAKIR